MGTANGICSIILPFSLESKEIIMILDFVVFEIVREGHIVVLCSLFTYVVADEPDRLILSYALAIPLLAIEANLTSLLCSTV